jgi:hypothetical protein
LSSASTRLLAQEDGQGGGEVRVVGAHVERDAFQHLLAASVGFLTGAVHPCPLFSRRQGWPHFVRPGGESGKSQASLQRHEDGIPRVDTDSCPGIIPARIACVIYIQSAHQD